jgi:membrane protein DedA with SNARE-associated domain
VTTLDAAIHMLRSEGLLLLFPLAIVEGPIVTVIAAYLASLGYLNVFAVFVVVVSADLVGDCILYSLGRFGHDVVLKRWGLRFGVDARQLAGIEAHFRSRGGRTLLIGKLTHAVGFIILFVAGASRMSFPTFLWYNLVGTLPKCMFFVVIGYTIGSAYTEIDSYILRASTIVFIAAVAFGLYWFARLQRKWA